LHSIISKITTITEADQITVGKNVYFALDNALRDKFSEITSQLKTGSTQTEQQEIYTSS
jgi:hypothetical protein